MVGSYAEVDPPYPLIFITLFYSSLRAHTLTHAIINIHLFLLLFSFPIQSIFQIMSEAAHPPIESYRFFLRSLQETVRINIGESMAASYSKLTFTGAKEILMFDSVDVIYLSDFKYLFLFIFTCINLFMVITGYHFFHKFISS